MTFRKPLATQAFSFAGMHCTNKKIKKRMEQIRLRACAADLCCFCELVCGKLYEIVTNSRKTFEASNLSFCEAIQVVFIAAQLRNVRTTCALPQLLRLADSLPRRFSCIWWRPCATMLSDQTVATVPVLFPPDLRVCQRSSTAHLAFQDGHTA